jgi:hypothetical protein
MSAVTGLYSARDLPGTDFTDPRAHGSGFQRIRAFGDGYEGGPRECASRLGGPVLLTGSREVGW